MTDAAALDPQYEIQRDPRRMIYIRIDHLLVDPNKQREIRDSRRCEERARHWDWAKAEAATVAPSTTEKDRYDVIEGQHRIVSLKQAIDYGLAPSNLTFPCFIIDGMNDAKQAQLGVDIPRSRGVHTALQKWRQDVRGGRPHQVMAETIMDDHGLAFGTGASSITISCVATVEKLIARTDARTGADYLDQTLTILEIAYPPGSLSAVARWNRHLITAVFDLVITKSENLDPDRLAAKLSLMPAESWVELGRGNRGSGYVTIRDELIKRYNLNLRARRI